MKNLFLTGLLGLGVLCSCSNEDDPANNNQNLPEGGAQAQIMINVASEATTRATGDTDAGTPEEQGVDKITVVLADQNGLVQQVITPKMKGATGDTDKRATEVFEVPAGKYYVYVLANYTANESKIRPALVVGQTNMKQEFSLTGMPFTADATLGITGSKFLMTNADAPTESDFTSTGTSGKEVDDDGTEMQTGGKDNVFVVKTNIERAVSKVTFGNNTTANNLTFKVEVDPDGDGTKSEIASTELQAAALINLNKKMYMNKVKDATISPASSWNDYYYVKDPNYTDFSKDNSWLTANFDQISAGADDFVSLNVATSPMLYCPENTMGVAADQKNGQTTGVVYKVKYTPNAYTTLNKAGSDSYSKIFAEVLKIADTKAEETTFTANGPTDGTFYVYNNLVFKNQKAAILYYCIATATGNTDAEKATAANTAYSSYLDGSGSVSSTPTDVESREAGINYYTAWIKHNPNGSNMEEGKFGTVRNHWYVLTVSSISGLGTKNPTYEDPEDPNDPAVANIQVAATIKKWVKVEQEVDL